MLAGAASIDITPDRPQWLDGFGNRTAQSEGAYQRITAKALVLRDGDAAFVILSAEVLAFDRGRVAALKERISHATGVDPGSIALLATHTHCAPRVCDMVMPGAVDPAYLAWFEERCVGVAAAAAGERTPVRIAFSRARDEELGINRRVVVDGKAVMRPNPDGPRDSEVDTFWFEAEDGHTVASLTVAGCHPTSRAGQLIGGDYPGFLWRELEAGAGGVALFGLGCAGDVRPRFTGPDGRFRMAEPEEVEGAGKRMAEAVLEARRGRRYVHSVALSAGRRQVDTPLQEPMEVELLREMAEADAVEPRRRWAAELIESRERAPRSVPFEMQALRLGPGAVLILWPGEVASEYGLWIKERLGGVTVAAAYANGAVGYVPSASMVPFGGYEVEGSHPFYNLPAPYAPDIDERFRAATLELLDEIGNGSQACALH